MGGTVTTGILLVELLEVVVSVEEVDSVFVPVVSDAVVAVASSVVAASVGAASLASVLSCATDTWTMARITSNSSSAEEVRRTAAGPAGGNTSIVCRSRIDAMQTNKRLFFGVVQIIKPMGVKKKKHKTQN